MFNQTFSHDTIRKYIVLFGTLFNNLYINREDSTGAHTQTLKIPLSYGPKEKFLARINSDPTLDKSIAIVLPRMSFELVTYSYATERKLNKINKVISVNADNKNVSSYQYTPVPYDFVFSLSIMTKNAQDGTRIVEQILPYFTPEWTATVNLIPGVKHDIPIILNDISSEDTYEGNFESRRAIIHTLTFTLKGYVFGPSKTANIIKEVDVNIRLPIDSVFTANNLTGNSAVVVVKPGLTANGLPTTNPSLSVSPSNISPNDNYGFLIDFIEN